MQKFSVAAAALALSLTAANADQWAGTALSPSPPSSPSNEQSTNPGGPPFQITSLPDNVQLSLEGLTFDGPQGPGSYNVQFLVPLADFANETQVAGLQTEINTIDTQFNTLRSDLAAGLAHQQRLSYGGIAEAMAMSGTADLQSDENFSVAFNMGTYGGETAFAGGAAARLSDHLSLNAGFSANTRGGPVGGRVGIRFGW